MPGSKEIRTKIRSVRNTQKITKAMEMVAASKRRKAQERMVHARPYGERIREIIASLAEANPEYRHPFLMQPKEPRRIGLIVVCSDKGLCAGLNTNLLRMVLTRLREDTAAKLQSPWIACLGNKGLGFFSRLKNIDIVSQAVHLGDAPRYEDLIGPVKIILDAFVDGKVDQVLIAYNRFINTMKQTPVLEQLLPIKRQDLVRSRRYGWDYIYEPDAKVVLDDLLLRYTEAIIFQALLENIASEQSARMVAMKAASDNAANVIDELQLIYNKARQAAITKEISEIVGGAAAV